MNKKSSTHDRELLISKVLDAPAALVWEAWTNPAHIARWWGPDGFTNTITVMDLTPGGKWELVMHGPDGTDYPNSNVFREVVPMKRIVYEHVSYPHIVATIDFEDRGERTLVHWHMLFDTAEVFVEVVKTYKADIGLMQNIEKLNVYLSQMRS